MTKKESAAEAAEKKKDHAGKNGKEPLVEKSVDELILNFNIGKYSAIPLAAMWAKILRRREEHRHLTSTEILELSLRQVLEGKIDWDDLKKAATSALPADGEAAEGKAKAK